MSGWTIDELARVAGADQRGWREKDLAFGDVDAQVQRRGRASYREEFGRCRGLCGADGQAPGAGYDPQPGPAKRFGGRVTAASRRWSPTRIQRAQRRRLDANRAAA